MSEDDDEVWMLTDGRLRRPGVDPNPAIEVLDYAIATTRVDRGTPIKVVKVQPPDALVLEMVDGSWWAVSAYRLKAGREDS